MQIRRLTLERFRRFQRFSWHPAPGINCLVGPGDGGKTTILEAIGRATSPAPVGPASEHDYHHRRTEDGFEIGIVIGALSKELLGAYPVAPCWGWRGPDEPMLDAAVDGAEPVISLQVYGTPDLEIEHRVLLPNGETTNFSADKRRLLALCRIGEMRGSSREFRMARGSLLERSVGREEVRGAAARAVREASVELALPHEVKQRLLLLGGRMKAEGVTDESLTLEMLSPAGQSLLGLLGLALGEPGEAIPLAQSGQGAQRLASYVLATELAMRPALVVMDEVELGLEPYRQRLLVRHLRELVGSGGQAFLTTHSPAVLEELEVGELHRVHEPSRAKKATPRISRLTEVLERFRRDDPECLLCRLPVVCEGATEVALLQELLAKAAFEDGFTLEALGIRLADGGGQPQAFSFIDALREAAFSVGAFLDCGQEHTGRQKRLSDDPQVILGVFSTGTCTEDALAHELDESMLDALLKVGEDVFSRASDSRRQQLNEHFAQPGNRWPSELAAEWTWPTVREGISMTAHQCGWFKSGEMARALAAWLSAGTLPTSMADDIRAFWMQIRNTLEVAGGSKALPADAASDN